MVGESTGDASLDLGASPAPKLGQSEPELELLPDMASGASFPTTGLTAAAVADGTAVAVTLVVAVPLLGGAPRASLSLFRALLAPGLFETVGEVEVPATGLSLLLPPPPWRCCEGEVRPGEAVGLRRVLLCAWSSEKHCVLQVTSCAHTGPNVWMGCLTCVDGLHSISARGAC